MEVLDGHKTKKLRISSKLFADWTGLEPATSAVTGRHSNQLNYQSFFRWGGKNRALFLFAKIKNNFHKKINLKVADLHNRAF
jgi:hypothetical protein